MRYIRAILAIIYVVVYLLVSIVLMPVTWILGKTKGQTRDRFVYSWVYWGLSCEYHICGAKVEVVGKENVPKDEAVLFVSNHRSIFDLIISLPVLGVPIAPVAKAELAKVPLLHWWMKAIHCMFLDRDDIKAGVAMIGEAVADIRSGLSVLIYPEGTRSRREGEFLPFHGGSFKIAIRSGAPVVPITMIGTGDILEDHTKKGHFPYVNARKVVMVIGEPIPTKDMSIQDRKALPEKCREQMMETYADYAASAE